MKITITLDTQDDSSIDVKGDELKVILEKVADGIRVYPHGYVEKDGNHYGVAYQIKSEESPIKR